MFDTMHIMISASVFMFSDRYTSLKLATICAKKAASERAEYQFLPSAAHLCFIA